MIYELSLHACAYMNDIQIVACYNEDDDDDILSHRFLAPS